eukprot:890907-Amphidinium_carterae.1
MQLCSQQHEQDPASGRTYYVNTATNAVQWDPPKAEGALEANSAPAPGSQPALPAGNVIHVWSLIWPILIEAVFGSPNAAQRTTTCQVLITNSICRGSRAFGTQVRAVLAKFVATV